MQINHIDSLSLSGHKFNGLKGQGLLLLKNIQNIEPIVHGGGQNMGYEVVQLIYQWLSLWLEL